MLDLVGHLFHPLPVAQVALLPDDAVRLVLPDVLGDLPLCIPGDTGPQREDVQLGNVVVEQRVGDAVSDAPRAAGDDADFAGEVGALVKAKVRRANLGRDAAKVLGDRVLHRWVLARAPTVRTGWHIP